MTTDLSNKSVEEVLTDVIEFFKQDLSDGHSWDFVDAVRPLIARRLEEAQQKIVAQQAVLQEIIDIGSGNRPDVNEDCAEGRMWRIALDFSDGKDFTALTANNAKVAAEALEEAMREWTDGWSQDYEGWKSSETLKFLGLLAAEYRAKAKGEKP